MIIDDVLQHLSFHCLYASDDYSKISIFAEKKRPIWMILKPFSLLVSLHRVSVNLVQDEQLCQKCVNNSSETILWRVSSSNRQPCLYGIIKHSFSWGARCVLTHPNQWAVQAGEYLTLFANPEAEWMRVVSRSSVGEVLALCYPVKVSACIMQHSQVIPWLTWPFNEKPSFLSWS